MSWLKAWSGSASDRGRRVAAVGTPREIGARETWVNPSFQVGEQRGFLQLTHIEAHRAEFFLYFSVEKVWPIHGQITAEPLEGSREEDGLIDGRLVLE